MLAGLILIINRGHGSKPAAAEAPVPVTVAKAKLEDLPLWQSGVGAVQPIEMVDVKPRVDGQIAQILFREGDEVAAGQPLARIDARPYASLVAQAEAARQRDQAQLTNAQLDLARSTKLLALGAATGRSVDTLRAQVATLTAEIAADEALLQTARLNRDWTVIRSPVRGRAGLRKFNTGAAVRADDAGGIVTVTQISPIAVVFTLSQDALPMLAKLGASAEVIVGDRTGTGDIAHGKLASIDSQVDGGSGQIRLKATFANQDRRLWPGALVSARLLAGVLPHTVTVPTMSVQAGQSGSFVYLVGAGNSIEARPVRTGPAVGDVTAIMSGVKAGETVVVSGHSRIAVGSKVAPRSATPAS